MSTKQFAGVFTPIATPFTSDDTIDEKGLASNVKRWMTTPLSGLVVLGSNGEAPQLDDREADRVVEIVRAGVPKDRPLIVGTGRESTKATIAATRRAADLGADAALVRTPSFFKSQMTTEVFIRHYAEVADLFPFIGVAVWIALVLCVPLRKPDWSLLPGAFKGSIFLLSLVLCASLMPVERLPAASWQTAFGLGFVSAVFDNIPLTALALRQGGYDWGFLAYAVGFGGSMLWFGSSAGVALSNMFPEAKSVGNWLRHGWHVALGYVVGFLVLLAVLGWHPDADHRLPAAPGASAPTLSADSAARP